MSHSLSRVCKGRWGDAIGDAESVWFTDLGFVLDAICVID